MLRVLAFFAASAAFALTSASMAQDQKIRDRITASQLEAMLKEAGLNPTMLRDKATGAPVATGVFVDHNNLSSFGQPRTTTFVVSGKECGGLPMGCEQLVLFANFDLGREVSEQDFRVVNAWNDSSVFGRAFVLESKRQIGIDFRVDMIGGVTGDHVEGRLGRWPEVMRDFRAKLEAASNGS